MNTSIIRLTWWEEIKLDNGLILSYNFYEHVSNYKDSWDTPTDILYGEHDELVYIENIADFLANHPNAKLTIKKGSQHYFHTCEEKEFIKNWILTSLTLNNPNKENRIKNENNNTKRIWREFW